EENIHTIDFAFKEKLLGEFGNSASLGELGRILVGEFSSHGALGAADELGAFSASGNEDSFVFVELGEFAAEVAVQGAREAFVAADDDDGAFAAGADFQERMLKIA